MVQTLGADIKNGGDVISIATGVIGDAPPKRFCALGDSMTAATNNLSDYTHGGDIFIANVNGLVLGEAAAMEGIEKYLDYVSRSVQLREDTPVFLVRGGTAENVVTKSGGKEHGITEILQTLQSEIASGGDGKVTTASDLTRAITENGGSVIQAIEPRSEKSADPNAEPEELTVVKSGLAVIKGYKLAGYIPQEDAYGVSLLTDSLGSGSLTLKTDYGIECVNFESQKLNFTPQWNEKGELAGVLIDVKLAAALAEMDRPEMLTGAHLDALNKALKTAAETWIKNVVSVSQRLQCDFLGIGRRLEVVDPLPYRAMTEHISARLPKISFAISVTATVGRSYSMSNPV